MIILLQETVPNENRDQLNAPTLPLTAEEQGGLAPLLNEPLYTVPDCWCKSVGSQSIT